MDSLSPSASRSAWQYALWALLPLVAFVFVYPAFMLPYRHTEVWLMSWAGLCLAGCVVCNCLWWFVSCPLRHWAVKTLTFLVLVLSIPPLVCFVLFVSSCAHVRESRVQELQRVMDAASRIPSGPDDFTFIDRIASGKRVLFIGEIPHHVPDICPVVLGLSLHLRKEIGYSVLAQERVYSCWPYEEAQSLGNSGSLPNVLPQSERAPDPQIWLGPLPAYNRSAPSDQRLLSTTLDLDHAIYHTKPQTVLYLGYLASLSSSSEARADLANAIPALLKLKGRAEIDNYLDDLGRRFHAAWGSFSPANQEEIDFSLALERASIDFQFGTFAGVILHYDLRSEYFRKTIQRAWAKAERSGGSLICHVGWGHAWLDQRPSDCEAGYFDQQFPATLGRVGSVLIEKLSGCIDFNLNGDFRPSALEMAALARMGDKDRIYVDLRDKSWASVKHRPRKFFPGNVPHYDGILFIK